MKTKKQKNAGFTLVEAMIVVTIIGILSATVTISISNYILERKSEEKVVAFFSQIQLIKSYAQRNNVRYIMELHPTATGANPRFSIFRDINDDKNLDNSEIIQLFPTQNSIATAIEFGLSTPTPENLDDENINGNIMGDWQTENEIIFEKDEIGTINTGTLFLKNTSADNVCYAITRPRIENALKLFKWNGRAWNEL